MQKESNESNEPNESVGKNQIEESIEKKPYVCEYCDLGFKSAHGLKIHQFKMHKDIVKEFKEKKRNSRIGGTAMAVDVPELKVTTKGFKINADQMALAQLLINSGVANDFTGLFEKGLYVLAHGGNNPKLGGGNMNEEDNFNLNKEMKKLLEQMQMKQAMEMIKGKEDSGGFDMNKLMNMFVMQNLMKNLGGGGEDKLNKEVESLKSQLQQQQLMNQFTAQINELKKSSNKNNGTTDLIIALEKIRADGEKKTKEIEGKLNRERENHLQEKIGELKESIQSSGNSGNQFERAITEKIQGKVLEKFDTGELFGAKQEKDTGQVAQELIGGVIDKIKEPLLAPLGQGLKERIAKGGSSIPQEFEPQFEMPQEMPIPQEMPVSQEMAVAPAPIKKRDVEVVGG